MGGLIALINIGILLLASLINDGSARYFSIDKKKGQSPLIVNFSASNLQAAGLAKKYIWTFGDGQTLSTTSADVAHTYGAAGIYTAKLQYLAKATDALSKAKDGGSVKIEVIAPANVIPTVNLNCTSNTNNTLECSANGSMDSDGTITSYKYEWGDGTETIIANANLINHNYSTSGSKTIKLTVTDDRGGTASVEKSFNLKENSAPVAGFDCQKIGIQKIQCKSTSTDHDETLSIFQWTLDDGTTYTTQNFDHTFSRPQDVAVVAHSVKLEVTDSSGLKDAITKYIDVDLETIRQAPRAYFKVFMDGTYVDLRSFITKTQFNIKRAYYTVYGMTSTPLQTIELTDFYANASQRINLESYGGYRINLTVIDMRDQVIQVSRPFTLAEETINLKPFVDFRAVQSNSRTVYINMNPAFDYDANLAIRSFTVNLGNGVIRELTGEDTFLTYTYPQAGTYEITVTAKTNHGTQATVTKAMTISDESVPAINPDPTFAYRVYGYAQNVSFYMEKSGTPNGDIISYTWNFGDGTIGYGQTQAHFYDPGTYIVSLTVVDSAGLSSTQTQKIEVLSEGDDLVARIDCTLQSPFVDLIQKCKVTALDRLNDISRVRVIWGDNTAFNLAAPYDANQGIYYPIKKYNTAGIYPVRVVVSTNRGVMIAHETTLKLTARPPVANISCSINSMLAFCDALASFDPKGGQLTFNFDFGDGQTETNLTGVINHAYQRAGLYIVKVTVVDGDGESSSAQTQVQALLPPNQLPFAALNCMSNRPLTLSCNAVGSSDPDGDVVSARYEFDDGIVVTYDPSFNFDHEFASPGQHSVNLIITDNNGGQYAIQKIFEVGINNPPFIGNINCFANRPQELDCYADVMDPDSGDIVTSFEWDMGDGKLPFSTLMPAIGHYRYDLAGEKKVKLVIKDQFGAEEFKEIFVEVKPNQAPVAQMDCQFTSQQTLSCNSLSYDPDGSDLHYSWEIDNVPSYSSYAFSHSFNLEGNHKIKLIVSDDLGLNASVENNFFVNINQAPVLKLNMAGGAGVIPFNVELDSKGTYDPDGAITNYKWFVNGQYVSDEALFQYSFNEKGVYEVKFLVEDNLGKTSEKIIMFGALDRDIEITKNVSEGYANLPISLSADVESDLFDKYEWFHNGMKIGEGLELNYTLDDVGNQNIEFLASSNLGYGNKKVTMIRVLEPDLYLSGDIPANAFVGHEYRADLSTKSMVTSMQLINAPEGMNFDSGKGIINWTPSSSQIGKHTFKARITNENSSYYKNIIVNVSTARIIGSFEVGTQPEQFVINDPNSDLDGALFEVNTNLGNEIRIYEGKSQNKTFLFVKSNQELDQPIHLSLTEKRKIGIQTDRVALGEHNNVEYVQKAFLEQNTSDIKYCNSVLEIAKKEEFDYNSYLPYPTSFSPYILGFIEQGVLKNTILKKRVLDVLEDTATLSSLQRVDNYKIYFTEGYDSTSYGAFYSVLPDSLFIYPDSLLNSYTAGMKYTLLHESFHLVQYRRIGCSKDQSTMLRDITFKSILEGSADIFAYSKLDNSIPRNAFNNRLLTDREFAIAFDYDQVNYPSFPQSFVDLIREGVLKHSYNSRFVFDKYYSVYVDHFSNPLQVDDGPISIDSLDLMDYFRQNKVDILSKKDMGNYLLNKYSKAKNLNLNNLLYAVTDNLSNKIGPFYIQHSTESNLVYNLKKEELFTWEVPDPIQMMNNSSGGNILNIVDGGNIGVNLEPMSGVSKTIKLGPQENILNYNYISLLTYDHSDDPDIGLQITHGNGIYNYYSSLAHSAGNEGRIVIYSSPFNGESRFRINVVNSGLVKKEVKIEIRSLCKEYTTPMGSLDVSLSCSQDCKRNNAMVVAILGGVSSSIAGFGEYGPNGSLSFSAEGGWFSQSHPQAWLHKSHLSSFGRNAYYTGKILVCQGLIGQDGIIEITPSWTVVEEP